ncbi:hypothetical protein PBNK5_39160 [Pectobacterium brasiliense]
MLFVSDLSGEDPIFGEFDHILTAHGFSGGNDNNVYKCKKRTAVFFVKYLALYRASAPTYSKGHF